MHAGGSIVWLAIAALTVLAVVRPGTAEAAPQSADPRTLELLDYLCTSDAGEQQLTLFGNGTLRLRSRGARVSTWSMSLVELLPDELSGFRNRLSDRPYDQEPDSLSGGPSGEWVEQCLLTLPEDEEGERRYRFSRVDSLSLELAYLVDIADELVAEASSRSLGTGFPAGYRPSRGDVVIRRDGSRFRIERFTSDGGGVELVGLESPLVLYIETDSIVGEFVGLEDRRGRP